MADNCPKCGAKLATHRQPRVCRYYVCGTVAYIGGEIHDGTPCLKNQLAQANATIAEQAAVIAKQPQ